MEAPFEVECQFISAGYNLKQWDLVKNANFLSSGQEHEVMKSPGTEFLSPIHPSSRHHFSSLVLDSSAKSVAALIIGNHELYISTLIEGMGFKKILLNSPHCLVFIGINDKFIAVGCHKGVFIVDTNVPKVIEFIRLPILEHKTDTVLCIDTSHDPLNPNLIAFATELGLLYYFHCFREKCNPEQICIKDPFSKILNLKFCPHLFSYLVTAHSSGAVNIWDLANNSCMHNFSFNSNTSSASLDFTHVRNDYLLCIGWNNGIVGIFNLKLMQKVIQFTIPDSIITGLLFVQNGVNLIVGDSLGQIHIYNTSTQKISRAYRLHSSTLKGLALKNIKQLSQGKQSPNGSHLLSIGASQSLEDRDLILHQSYEQMYLANLNNSLNPITSKISSLKSTKPINAENAQSPVIISPLRMDFNSNQPSSISITNSRTVQDNPDQYRENTQMSCLAQTFRDDRYVPIRELPQEMFNTANSLIPTIHENLATRLTDRSITIGTNESISLLHDNLHLKGNSPSSNYYGENDIATINESNKYIKEDSQVLNHHQNKLISNPNKHNAVDIDCIQSIMEHHSSDIKDFFGEHMINLLGEITRNVTNQQLQIASLHNKLDMLLSSFEKILKTISQNPHLI